MRKSTLATLLAVPLAAVMLACGAGDTGASTSSGDGPDVAAASQATVQTVKAGQALTLTEAFLGDESAVTITLKNVKYGVKSGNDFIKADKGQFITADITVEVKKGKVSISSSEFKLVAKDGTVYDTTIFLDDNLMAMDLTPGQKKTGKIAFDAAVGAEKGAKIALKSWLAEGDAGYWTL